MFFFLVNWYTLEDEDMFFSLRMDMHFNGGNARVTCYLLEYFSTRLYCRPDLAPFEIIFFDDSCRDFE